MSNKSLIQSIQKNLDTINALRAKQKTAEELRTYQNALGLLNKNMESGMCLTSRIKNVVDIDLRYQIQYTTMPHKTVGNLSPYSGEQVGIILTHDQYQQSRIHYFIFKIKK